MHEPYLCPACRNNRTHFRLIYKLGQEVRKDPSTGEIVFADEEWQVILRRGSLDLDVTCLACDYTRDERRFIDTARREVRLPDRVR